MALNAVTIVKKTGALGKDLPSDDCIAGFVFYVNALPASVVGSKFAFASLGEVEKALILNAFDTQVIWYHLSEYFRTSQGGKCFVRLVVNTAFDGNFNEVIDLQNFALGEIRQFGVYAPLQSLTTAHIGNLQQRMVDLEAVYTPAVVIYAPKIIASDMTTLPDLRQLTNSKVSVVIGQDGGGLGVSLASANFPTISCIGAVVGEVSSMRVSESIAWVQKGNVVTTAYPNMTVSELDVPAFGDGSLIRNYLISQLNTINDKGYIFLRKHIGIGGTYFNDEFTADRSNSDFNNIHANRTMDKATRLIRKALLPRLSGPIEFSSNGTIDASFVAFLKDLGGAPLQNMKQGKEITDFAFDIDPKQLVLSTSSLVVNIKIIPVGVANNITANIGFALKLN